MGEGIEITRVGDRMLDKEGVAQFLRSNVHFPKDAMPARYIAYPADEARLRDAVVEAAINSFLNPHLGPAVNEQRLDAAVDAYLAATSDDAGRA